MINQVEALMKEIIAWQNNSKIGIRFKQNKVLNFIIKLDNKLVSHVKNRLKLQNKLKDKAILLSLYITKILQKRWKLFNN